MDWHFNILTVDKARDRKTGYSTCRRKKKKPTMAAFSFRSAKQHNLGTLPKSCFFWGGNFGERGGLSALNEMYFQLWHPPICSPSFKCRGRLMLFGNFLTHCFICCLLSTPCLRTVARTDAHMTTERPGHML